MSNRDKYLSEILAHQNNFYVTLACISLIHDKNVVNTLKEDSVTLSDKVVIKFSHIVDYLNDDEHLEVAANNLLMTSMKSIVKDCYEIVLKYSKESNRVAELKSQEWYQFSRLCRNCLSHTQTFEFRDYDKSLFPVTWNGITIDESLDGKNISKNFGASEVRDLIMSFRAFLS